MSTRKVWRKPVLVRLEAGAAEKNKTGNDNQPGTPKS
jgi:hypothetical protein